MIKVVSKIFGIGAIIAPIITTLIMLKIEPEIEEALAGGIILGCLIGSVFGVVALICNKHRSRLILVASIIPMIPTAIFFVLAIPFWLYG